MVKNDDTYFEITTTEKQKQKNKNSTSSVILGECEDILKDYYKISEDKPLLIFKIDYYQPSSKIPLIGYKVYHPDTKEKLDLNVCKNANVELNIYADIDDNIDKHDPNSKYFNDQCYPSTSENGHDITLNDRKSEYNSNNMSLCVSECNFNGYDTETKEVICICGVSSEEFSISNLANKTDILYHNFSYSDGNSQIVTLKCFNTLFTKEGLAKNIGSYILLFIILLFICSGLLFYKSGYPVLEDTIKEILKSKKKEKNIKDKNIHIKETSNEISKNKKKKDKKVFNFKKEQIKVKERSKPIKKIDNSSRLIQLADNSNDSNKLKKSTKKRKAIYHHSHITNNLRINKINIICQQIAEPNKDKKVCHEERVKDKDKFNYNNYIDFELNSFTYEEALKIDKRTFCEYYASLIRTKNIIIFSFYPIKNYNSYIIKVDLFFLSFSFYYFVNALFFDEITIHKIYEGQGLYNLINLIPNISYSFVISHLISTLIKYIFLSERNIILIKRENTYNAAYLKADQVKKRLTIKYICFYCIGLIFLIFFWYYLSSFGAVLQNTQIYLIKSTAICFSVSIFYPFFINVFPAILRKCSLKDDKSECLYKVHKFFQLI